MFVMIVGAGPAGLRAAHGLQRQQVAVVMVEAGEVGGWLNQDRDYENHTTRTKHPSLALKAELVAPWGRFGPPVLHDHVISANWDRRAHAWHVQMARGQRTVSWLLLASGVVPRTGGLTPSSRVFIGPSKDLLPPPLQGQRLAILGGGDNAFEFACHYLAQGVDVQMFLRAPKGQAKFVDAIPAERLHPATMEVEDRGDGVWVEGERFDACGVFYGFEPQPIALTVDHVPLAEARLKPGETLPFQLIGDAATGAPWWVERALVSADVGVARVMQAMPQRAST